MSERIVLGMNIAKIGRGLLGMARACRSLGRRMEHAALYPYVTDHVPRVLAVLSFAVSALTPMPSGAQQPYNLYAQPLILYKFANVQDDACGVTTPPATWGTLAAAWTWSQGAIDGTCSDGVTATALDLVASTQTFDGYPVAYDFSVQACQSGSCNLLPNIGWIQQGYTCPINWGAADVNYPSSPEIYLCALSIYNILPCPYCFGDPIYPATGQNFEPETDYQSPWGPKFTRTYRSDKGQFSSIVNQSFVNNSGPAGVLGERCYAGNWTYGGQSGSYCFPYESAYPDSGSSPQYQLLTEDGVALHVNLDKTPELRRETFTA